MPRSIPLALLLAAVLATVAPPARGATAPVPAPATAAGDTSTAVVLETARGRIVIRLADGAAPRTCANFRRLVAQGFYDSTCFHRVIAGFMIQGGDPNSRDADPFNDGEGGPGWTVPAEIGLPHLRGSVAMARLPDAVNRERASNGSQFFICVADRPDLDRGGYTVFGQVVSGLETVDAIVALGAIPGIARTQSGPNPERLALVRRARLEPLAKWVKPAAAAPAR
jgi:cyclophilin family peptidyl-prolyl cis-trans isomerase